MLKISFRKFSFKYFLQYCCWLLTVLFFFLEVVDSLQYVYASIDRIN